MKFLELYNSFETNKNIDQFMMKIKCASKTGVIQCFRRRLRMNSEREFLKEEGMRTNIKRENKWGFRIDNSRARETV